MAVGPENSSVELSAARGHIGVTWTTVNTPELVREGAIGSEKGPIEVNRCGAGEQALAGKAVLPMREARLVRSAAEYRVG